MLVKRSKKCSMARTYLCGSAAGFRVALGLVVRVVRHGCICVARGGMGVDTVLLDDALEDPALAALMARIPQQVLRIDIVCTTESPPEHDREGRCCRPSRR